MTGAVDSTTVIPLRGWTPSGGRQWSSGTGGQYYLHAVAGVWAVGRLPHEADGRQIAVGRGRGADGWSSAAAGLAVGASARDRHLRHFARV